MILAISATLLVMGCQSPVDSPSDPTGGDTVISVLAIPGINLPVRGETPVTSVTSTQYTGTVSWTPTISSTFGGPTVYTATITLTPASGFTLTGVAANGFTVSGASSVSNDADSGTVTAVFPTTLSFTLNMVQVPAGSFQRDGTATNVSTVSAFYLADKEITRGQYQELMGSLNDPSDTTISSGITYPVQNVNWYQAIAFCNKLSLAEGLDPVYTVSGVDFASLTYGAIPADGSASNLAVWNAVTATWTNNGYRLPTDMEWMWAAMGAPPDGQNGGTNATGYLLAFSGSTGSNSAADYAWYGKTVTHSVDSGDVAANGAGILDMSGNVWEWCWDWNGSSIAYPDGSLPDYRGKDPTDYRVVRGGGYDSAEADLALSSGVTSAPYYLDTFLGFRVARY